MTNNIHNVPRELLADLLGNDHDKRIMAERHLLAMLANAPSPAGVDGPETICVTQGGCNVSWTATKVLSPAGTALCRLSDAQGIIDGLRGEVECLTVRLDKARKDNGAQLANRATIIAQRDQQAQRIGELAELAAQASVNCKNTAYYLRKYRPDLADICSGWCVAIDAALTGVTE